MLNNSKSITAPSRATPKWLGISAIVLLVGYFISSGLEPENSIQFKDYVKWRTLAEGKQEAKDRSMPIFEVVTGDVEGAQFKNLERHFFSDPTLAGVINKEYIPVRSVSTSSYNRWEPQIDYSKSEKNKCDFVTVRIVPIDFQDRSCDDYRLPHFYSAPGWKQGMLQFLSENKFSQYHSNMYYDGFSLAKHHWAKLQDAPATATKENKKVLYFFFRHFDDGCTNMMRYPFDDYNQRKVIDKHFVSTIVLERSSPSAKNPKHVSDLLAKYEVKSFPTLVSLDPKSGKFTKLGGTYNRNEIDDFLKKEISH